MLSHLLALTLGALSLVNAAPSYQEPFDSCSVDAHTATSLYAMATSGTFEIHGKALDGAAVRVYLPGQPLYASLSTEDAMDYKLFEMTVKNKNMASFRHIGLDLPVTVDNDNWVSTAQSKEDFEIFMLESANGNPGYFVIHSAVSRDLVWTLNAADGDVSQNIKVAPRVSGSQSQLFTFTPGKTSVQLTLEQLFSIDTSYNFMNTVRVEPGAYAIFDVISRAPIRTGQMGEPIYSSRASGEQYPGNAGLWDVSIARDPQGFVYTIRNIGLNMQLGVTNSKNLAPTPGAPAKFVFVPHFQDGVQQVVIHMADRSGVWGPDVSQGFVTTQIQIQPEGVNRFQTFILERVYSGVNL